EVEFSEKEEIQWESFDEKNNVWYSDTFKIKDGKLVSENTFDEITIQLLKILQKAKRLNPAFLSEKTAVKVKTKLDFPRNWGLGSSSTLINNIAQWAKIDGFALLANSFGGSGYDIAAAQSNAPILYELKNEKSKFRKVHLPWDFTDSLFFVHLNKKQDSKDGIARYRNISVDEKIIQRISDISNKLL